VRAKKRRRRTCRVRENGRGNPPETNERLPYKTIVVVVVVVGRDGSYALVHRGGGGPGTVDQDVLLLLFLRRGRRSCDSIIAAAAAGAIATAPASGAVPAALDPWYAVRVRGVPEHAAIGVTRPHRPRYAVLMHVDDTLLDG